MCKHNLKDIKILELIVLTHEEMALLLFLQTRELYKTEYREKVIMNSEYSNSALMN